MKKMPAIPPESRLKGFAAPIYYAADERGTYTVRFDARRGQGQAALAAYCMAVIDVLIQRATVDSINAWTMFGEEGGRFYSEFRAFLLNWRAEWARYGGFCHA